MIGCLSLSTSVNLSEIYIQFLKKAKNSKNISTTMQTKWNMRWNGKNTSQKCQTKSKRVKC